MRLKHRIVVVAAGSGLLALAALLVLREPRGQSAMEHVVPQFEVAEHVSASGESGSTRLGVLNADEKPAGAPPTASTPGGDYPWEVDDHLEGLSEETDGSVVNRRVLTSNLHEFRRALSNNPGGVNPVGLEAKQLQLRSIATLLDRSGRGYDEPEKYGIEEMKRRYGGDHFFIFGRRFYVFRRGEFPEYDRVVDFQLQQMKLSEQNGAPAQYIGGLDSTYFADVEARAIEVLSLLYAK